MKVLVVYYSLYGHIYRMAQAVAEGARAVSGTAVDLHRVPETLPDEVLRKMGAADAQKQQAGVPVCTVDELAKADAIIFGTPTRFGNMCGQMRQFLDATGKLWAANALVGKVGSVFASSNAQHGGQESTILSFHITLLHHGMVIVGLPYAFKGQTKIGGDHRRLSLRRLDHRGRRRQPCAERERACGGPIPGRARGEDREQAGALTRAVELRFGRLSLGRLDGDRADNEQPNNRRRATWIRGCPVRRSGAGSR